MVFDSVTLVVPIDVHVLPSGDEDAVNVLPLRTSLSQTGADPEGPATNDIEPPADARDMNSSPPPGFTSRSTVADAAVRSLRNMMPALANAFVLVSEATRATICPSPVIGWFT